MTKGGFDGFPRETVSFLSELAKNNDKAWFEERKGDYEQEVLEPARAFVAAMGERLKKISQGVVADPRRDKSIFRIYRDVRFGKDKRPYKTHLGIFFWEGKAKKMECPGFYFHLEPPNLTLGAGLYMFSPAQLSAYRESAVHPRRGRELAKAAAAVRKSGPYEIGVQRYKRVPRGYDKDHENAEFLTFGGLTAMVEAPIPKELYSEAVLDYCFARWKHMAPIHKWLLAMNERVK